MFRIAEHSLDEPRGAAGVRAQAALCNGRSTYPLPDVGSAHSCTHTVPLETTDLVNGDSSNTEHPGIEILLPGRALRCGAGAARTEG
jgi:hypothetical protein